MRLRGLWFSLLFIAVTMAGFTPVFAEDELASAARRVVELTNEVRVNSGLLPLKWNDTLAAAAIGHARDMADRGYFSHNSPEGSAPSDRARAAGYSTYGGDHIYVGENLARGYADPDSTLAAWMVSPGHRQNVLWPQYREIGVGVAVRENGSLYWAQLFGSRPKELPVFINGDAPETNSEEVVLSITAEDVSNWGSLDRIEAVMVSNSPNFAGAAWEPYAPSKQWTLDNRPGQHRVYVRLMDLDGDTVEASDEITLTARPVKSSGPEQAPSSLVSEEPESADEQEGDRL